MDSLYINLCKNFEPSEHMFGGSPPPHVLLQLVTILKRVITKSSSLFICENIIYSYVCKNIAL